jgi:hypothetical protein
MVRLPAFATWVLLAPTIEDKAEGAYARSDLLGKRCPLMDAWPIAQSRSHTRGLLLGRGRRAGA